MAVITRRSPLSQARFHRIQLPQYLRLDGGRYLIAAALFLSLMSLLTLGQTGQLAAKGFVLAELQRDKTLLLREQSKLNLQISEAQSLNRIRQQAKDLELRPLTLEQTRYVDVAPIVAPVQALPRIP
jgi:hypothetical protein